MVFGVTGSATQEAFFNAQAHGFLLHNNRSLLQYASARLSAPQ
jgi:hypothetical protein